MMPGHIHGPMWLGDGAPEAEVPVLGLVLLIVIGLLGMAGFVWLVLTMMGRRVRNLYEGGGQTGVVPGLRDLMTEEGRARLFCGPREHDLGWLAPPERSAPGWRAAVHRRENGLRFLLLTQRRKPFQGRTRGSSFVAAFREVEDLVAALDRAARGRPLDGDGEPTPPDPKDVRGLLGLPDGRYLGELGRTAKEAWPVHVYHDPAKLTLVSRSKARGRSHFKRCELSVEALMVLRDRLGSLSPPAG